MTYHAAYEPQRAIRTSASSTSAATAIARRPCCPTATTARARTCCSSTAWRSARSLREQLYDLVFDPNEAGNLAGDPAHAPVLEDLRGRLDEWMARTDDPLLDGEVAPPEGALVNGPDQRSPAEPSETVEGAVPRA